jgi:signal peptidase I
MEFQFLEKFGREMRDSILHLLRDYSEALLLALVLAIVLRTFVFSAYKVSNVMMEPSLRLGDFVVGYKLPYGLNVPFTGQHIGQASPRRGDVLIFKCPSSPESVCVKRAVAIAGDRVEIRGQRLIVNGTQAKYAKSNKTAPVLSAKFELVAINEKIMRSERDILISNANQSANFGPYVVPPDSFFALGDNRDFSEDSRHWGAVPNKNIEARASSIWLSIDWQEDLNGDYHSKIRKDRLFTSIH